MTHFPLPSGSPQLTMPSNHPAEKAKAHPGERVSVRFTSSLKEEMWRRREALLQTSFFEVGDVPYKGQDVLDAVEKAVKKRSRNLLLWLAAPLWVFGEDRHPRYVGAEQVKFFLPSVATNPDEVKKYHDGLDQALDKLVTAQILKRGSAGDWLGMMNLLKVYAVAD